MTKTIVTKVLIPSGALGLYFDYDALRAGIAQNPDVIAIDGGSKDSGPYYLDIGSSKYSRSSTKAHWRDLMLARAEANVPLVIGTAGTCGADDTVDWLVAITREIAMELGHVIRLAVLNLENRPQGSKPRYPRTKSNRSSLSST